MRKTGLVIVLLLAAIVLIWQGSARRNASAG